MRISNPFEMQRPSPSSGAAANCARSFFLFPVTQPSQAKPNQAESSQTSANQWHTVKLGKHSVQRTGIYSCSSSVEYGKNRTVALDYYSRNPESQFQITGSKHYCPVFISCQDSRHAKQTTMKIKFIFSIYKLFSQSSEKCFLYDALS